MKVFKVSNGKAIHAMRAALGANAWGWDNAVRYAENNGVPYRTFILACYMCIKHGRHAQIGASKKVPTEVIGARYMIGK